MLITFGSTESYARREAGGKGYSLYLLTREGFPVPRWVVLGAGVFRRFRCLTGIETLLCEKLKLLQNADLRKDDLENTSASIRKVIMETPFPREVEDKARNAYSFLSCGAIAIRSSAVGEDSAQYSFAGQLSSFLFVESEEEALRLVKECWASAYSERSLSYRIQNKLGLAGEIDVAVIFQEMIDSERSGVLFTCDPTREDASKITVNSVYGLGEALVTGLAEADTFLLEKETGEKISQQIAWKTCKLVRKTSNGGTSAVPVPRQLQHEPSLTAVQLKELSSLGTAVEKFYRYPQDIEWGWTEGKLFLLQSRPVTTPIQANQGTLHIWDNSNIIESYGGITLPLTFTFARFVYQQVYVQFCEILMVPKRQLRNMDYFLRNMLGICYGRIYYNLINWYRLTSILPGFKYNRSFMETMMGTSESLSDEIADRIKPPGFQENFSSKIRRLASGFKFVWFHFRIQSVVDGFLQYFNQVYREYRKKNYSRMSADEIYDDYRGLERKLLREWKAPIINDYLCMIHFGILKRLTAMWLSSSSNSLQNDLFCGEGNLESAEPTRELIQMATIIQQNPCLKDLLESTPNEDCLEVLKQSKYVVFTGRIERYIDQFGFRCMNEMKLEQKDLHQDPSFLFVCLKNYIRWGQVGLAAWDKRQDENKRAAEKKVYEAISGMKRVTYFWSLKHARKAVRNRESTRFCRTRIYGVVRGMFYGIGKDYTSRSIIDRPDDIFYLNLDELTGSLEGTLTVENLRALISLRKAEYARYERVEPAPRFITRGPVYWMNSHFAEEERVEAGDLPGNCLKGIGCCPGVVEGRVKLIRSPKDDMELNGEILVSLWTDPGWVPLYPSASGLLVERGGLLSHSAIVAREMGLPTIVGVKGLTQKIKTGMEVRLNGATGVVEILAEAVR